MEKEKTYGLELNTLLSVRKLQGEEGPIVTHVVNFMPPIEQWQKEKEERKKLKKENDTVVTKLEVLASRDNAFL